MTYAMHSSWFFAENFFDCALSERISFINDDASIELRYEVTGLLDKIQILLEPSGTVHNGRMNYGQTLQFELRSYQRSTIYGDSFTLYRCSCDPVHIHIILPFHRLSNRNHRHHALEHLPERPSLRLAAVRAADRTAASSFGSFHEGACQSPFSAASSRKVPVVA